ncbi:MAG: BrnA antitoxin family protein [Gammaproteobacteria bacterium]|nr:BrnA antitoxin family protein [Gammaproteobacteria bacterium]MBT8444407.1 BrnA antitoxin family protein [Gammaproteobacteria bacterium]
MALGEGLDQSRTDWDRLDSMRDEDIDLSDIPEITPEMWKHAVLVEPDTTQQVTLRVKRSVLEYFKAGGKGYQTRMNQVLESYVRAQRTK